MENQKISIHWKISVYETNRTITDFESIQIAQRKWPAK